MRGGGEEGSVGGSMEKRARPEICSDPSVAGKLVKNYCVLDVINLILRVAMRGGGEEGSVGGIMEKRARPEICSDPSVAGSSLAASALTW
ncbi:hypothetical protein PoB_001605000 [Plakobranchus ocellatus]|uniref:Uncharacterized protein n=1 Tax=Plakobranchus ocellatus TaxID=259542 RepID=A0AAV3Z4J4_9GAST|nr:hypothetical protein PoB_001605000 [Plakobranchus ocellatus]